MKLLKLLKFVVKLIKLKSQILQQKLKAYKKSFETTKSELLQKLANLP